MGQFLTKLEAARLLNVGPQHLDELEVPECPYGYSREVIEEFAARNGLPIFEELWNLIVCGEERAPYTYAENIKEALFLANSRTKAIISTIAFEEDVYNICVDYGIKLIYVGESCEHSHLNVPSFEDALHILGEPCQISSQKEGSQR